MNRELWDHQQNALVALRQSIGHGVKRIVLQAPTGAGKTLLSAAIVEGAQKKGNRMAFVVSSISLIDQTVEAFYSEGIRDIGVIQANHELTSWDKPVQVCSVQTLRRRGAYPEAQIVVIDECHVLHDFHKKWLLEPGWKDVPFIGLSATPWTKGLGKYFDSLLIAATTRELIDKGLLSKFRVFATGHPDLRDVKIVAGDYHEGELSDAMQAGTLTADIVRTWQEKWGKDKTLVFGVDCAHAKALQERFISAGVKAAYQDARTPDDERRAIRKGFHDGAYQVVCNVGTLTTGVDWDVRCLVLARPTRSEMLFVQIIGRALRTAPGKEHALILDHSDTTMRMGFVTDIHHDGLDDGLPKAKAERRVRLPKECPSCQALRPKGHAACPHCGFKPEVVSGTIERDGELMEINPDAPVYQKKGASRNYTMAEKTRFLAQLKAYGLLHGRKPGWSAWSYKEKFGVWPDPSIKNTPPASMVDVEVKAWIKSRQIAFAKSRKNPANAGARA
jgi:superfamily II DNA or RNA helicase